MANTRAEVQTRLTLRDEASGKMRSATQTIVSEAKRIALGVAGAAAAYQTFNRFIVDSVDASIQHERALNALTTAGFKNVTMMDRRAEALEAEVNVSSDLILQQIAIARQYGATESKAADLVKASFDLAAAIGVSQEQAFRQLSKTLGGYAGELAESLPAIKELTAEQLKSGGAVDIIQRKYGGLAQQLEGDTLGAIRRIRIESGDLQQAMGDLFREIVGGESVLDNIAAQLERDVDSVTRFSAGVGVLREEMERIGNTAPGVDAAIAALSPGFGLVTGSTQRTVQRTPLSEGASGLGFLAQGPQQAAGALAVRVVEYLGAKSLAEAARTEAANSVGLAARGIEAVKDLRNQKPISERPVQGPEPESDWDAALRMASMSLEDLRAAAEESAGALRSEATMRNLREGGFFDTSGFNPFTGPGDSGFSTGQLTNPSPAPRVSQIPIDELRAKYDELGVVQDDLAQNQLDDLTLLSTGFETFFASAIGGTKDLESAFLRMIASIIQSLVAQNAGGGAASIIGSIIGAGVSLLDSDQQASPLNRETRNRAMARELAPYLREATARNQVARR